MPPEFEARRKDYIRLVINEIYPKVAHKGLAKYCDAFVEKGVFTFEEAQEMLEACTPTSSRTRAARGWRAA